MSLLRQRRVILQVQNLLKLHSPRFYSSSTAGAEHYDIIIGGGGLVGTALAAALSKTPSLADKRVLLLEGAPAFKGFDETGPYANRVSAINENTVQLFKRIGAWDRIAAARLKAVKQMHVWDACSDAHIEFHDDNFARDVAFVVENDLMLDALYKLLNDGSSAPNVHVRHQARIESVQLADGKTNCPASVCLKDGVNYSCDLLVGADGANSIVRQEMGVDVYSIDYKSRGVVATLKLADSGDNCVAWQRFLPTGPLALLPLTENMSSLVWSTTTQHAEKLLKLPDDIFVEQLNEALCKEYAKSDVVSSAVQLLNTVMGKQPLRQYPPRVMGIVEKSRAAFPLSFMHAASYVRSGTALVGDAAHRVHPLAGQGVNLGFSDVVHLVDTLGEAAYAGAKLGDIHHLLKYEQKSLQNNVPIVLGIHSLQSMYTTDFSPVVLLRSLGLQFTHNLPALKNIFMKRAMG